MSGRPKKSRYHARYLWKEKHRRQYTFTKTKFAVGFVISVLFSVFMGSYFDQFGQTVLRQGWQAFKEALTEPNASAQSVSATNAAPPAVATVASTPSDIGGVEDRVRNLKLADVEEAIKGTPLEAKLKRQSRAAPKTP